MDKVECEKCPIAYNCEAYKEARKDNENSYHPQNVVRAYGSHCPLVYLAKQLQDRGFPKTSPNI